jgi:hypothetical protein
MISPFHVSLCHVKNKELGCCDTASGYVQDWVLKARVNCFVIGLVLRGCQHVIRYTKSLILEVHYLISCQREKFRSEVRMEQVSKRESEKCGPSRSCETFTRLLFIIE